MIPYIKKSILALLVLITILLPAQGSVIGATYDTNNQDVEISTTPSSPVPGDRVSIELKTIITNLDNADISWYVNNKLAKEGIGIKKVSITALGVGSVLNISATIKTLDAGIITKSVSINPTLVDVLWQANSYTPPFYGGKALPSPQTIITFNAIPILIANGVRLKSSDLLFNWKLNDQSVMAASGRGRDVFIVNTSAIPSDQMIVSVTVSDSESNLTGTGLTIVKNTSPEISFYEVTPLQGAKLNKIIGPDYTLSGSEISMIGYPYFLGVNSQNRRLLISSWTINNNPIGQNIANGIILTVRKPDKSGISELTLSVSNGNKVFQKVKNAISVRY